MKFMFEYVCVKVVKKKTIHQRLETNCGNKISKLYILIRINFENKINLYYVWTQIVISVSV